MPAELQTPEYRWMTDHIVNADSTGIFGAAAIGIIEAGIWERCRLVPTRVMILEASQCQSYEEAFALEERLVAQIEELRQLVAKALT